jgi:hypothetical protein
MPAFKFRISQRKGKKYDALFADGRVVSFGGLRGDGRCPRSPDPRAEPREPWLSGKPYDQYKDRTSLKAYSAYDHKDKTRRKAYYSRHGPLDEENPYTADWFSKKYLW